MAVTKNKLEKLQADLEKINQKIDELQKKKEEQEERKKVLEEKIKEEKNNLILLLVYEKGFDVDSLQELFEFNKAKKEDVKEESQSEN